jgi:hypothetical protein
METTKDSRSAICCVTILREPLRSANGGYGAGTPNLKAET